jgi:hypothetical protein
MSGSDPGPESSLDDLIRILTVGARGADELKVGDAFHLVIQRGTGNSWSVRACMVDETSAPLPHAAAYDDTLPPQESMPRAAVVLERLLTNARGMARRRLLALKSALGDER